MRLWEKHSIQHFVFVYFFPFNQLHLWNWKKIMWKGKYNSSEVKLCEAVISSNLWWQQNGISCTPWFLANCSTFQNRFRLIGSRTYISVRDSFIFKTVELIFFSFERICFERQLFKCFMSRHCCFKFFFLRTFCI